MDKEQKAAKEMLNILNAFNMMEFKMDLIVTGYYTKEDDAIRQSFAYNIFGNGRIDFETKRQMIEEIMSTQKIDGNTNMLAKCGRLRNEIAHGVHLWRGKEVFTVGRKKKIKDFDNTIKKAKSKLIASNELLDHIIDNLELPISKGAFLDHD